MIKLNVPITDKEILKELHRGDMLLLSGTIFTARDSAHKRILQLLEEGKPLPFDPQGAVLYYTGPSPTRPGAVTGSIGPTTSYRMDPYTPAILAEGVAITIGKGTRSLKVRQALQEQGAIYCAAYGGAGAFLASKIIRMELVAFEDLGPEAVYRLEVQDFPVTVINDVYGHDLYEEKGGSDERNS